MFYEKCSSSLFPVNLIETEIDHIHHAEDLPNRLYYIVPFFCTNPTPRAIVINYQIMPYEYLGEMFCWSNRSLYLSCGNIFCPVCPKQLSMSWILNFITDE